MNDWLNQIINLIKYKYWIKNDNNSRIMILNDESNKYTNSKWLI